MSSNTPNRRTAVELPSRRKHALLAACALMVGFMIPVVSVSLFGKTDDAVAEGRISVASLPKAAAISPLDDETLETPDLLAGDVPEGINPTDQIAAKNPATKEKTDSEKIEPKRIEVTTQARHALPRAPIAGLTRNSAFGPVPKRGTNTALKAYRRQFTAQPGKRSVSVIVGGLGINTGVTQQAIDRLPADVTLSFAAHTIGLQNWINTARADGHEVLIELQMESASFDPSEQGANRALRINAQANRNTQNLEWTLARAQGYAGVINFNGDLFLTRTDVAAKFMDDLAATGLGFVTDGSFETPSLEALAKTVDQPLKIGHGLIDPDPIPQVINSRLTALADTAKVKANHPVGVGFAFPETIDAIEAWIATLDAQGLQIAPATAALN